MNKRRRRKKIDEIRNRSSRRPQKKSNFLASLISKIMISTILFLIFAISIQSNEELATKFNNMIFGNDINFGQNLKSLASKFGKLIPFENFIYGDSQAVFEDKNLDIIDVKQYNDGYIITLKENSIISPFENGIVSYNGEMEGYGHILAIQQNDGVEVRYGNLVSNELKIYDFVTTEDIIGQVKEDELYIAILKDGKFLSYDEYIELNSN